MRRLLIPFVLLTSLPLAGQNVRFDPPAPDSRTAVVATFYGSWQDGCPPLSGTATVLPDHRIVVHFNVSFFPCPIAPFRVLTYRVPVDLGVLPAGVYAVEAHVLDTVPLVASGRLIVREAAPALRVTPSVVFRPQSTKVRIHVSGIGTCLPNVSPCIPPKVSVTFNGAAASSVSIVSADDIDAVVPGIADPSLLTLPIDVVVSTDDGRRAESQTALFLVSAIAPPDPALFERILIPIIFAGPGALGSVWTTDAWIENASAYDVPFVSAPFPTTPCTTDCNYTPIPAGTTRKIAPLYPTGVFIYPERGADIRLGLLVRDLSRQAEALGAEVPVVREKDWKSGSLTLLNIPSDPRFRITLRVYLEDETDLFGAVPIRVSRMSDPTTIAQTSVPMDSSHGVLLAATGWIDDVARAIALAPGDPIRIEVRAPEGGSRFWAFVSVTNNETQHVTIISPQ
jgi:hypothetical protein